MSRRRSNESVRDEVLDKFTKTANDELLLSQKSLRQMILHARNCGTALREAKARIGHGNWLTWLDSNFHGSRRVAQDYMRISKQWDPILERELRDNPSLGIEAALKILRMPNYLEGPTEEPKPDDEKVAKRKELAFHEAELRKDFASSIRCLTRPQITYLADNWLSLWTLIRKKVMAEALNVRESKTSQERRRMIEEHMRRVNDEEAALDYVEPKADNKSARLREPAEAAQKA